MAENMSQSDIDALVQSLLVGGAAASPAPQPAKTVSPTPQSPAAAATKPTVVDLGPIEQSEIDALVERVQAQKDEDGSEALRRAMAAVGAQEIASQLLPVPEQASLNAAVTEVAAARVQPLRPQSPDPGALPSSVLLDVTLTLSVELGRVRMPLKQILTLGPGSVITLENSASDPVPVCINQIPVMKADVVVIGENYGIRLTEVNLGVNRAS